MFVASFDVQAIQGEKLRYFLTLGAGPFARAGFDGELEAGDNLIPSGDCQRPSLDLLEVRACHGINTRGYVTVGIISGTSLYYHGTAVKLIRIGAW